MLNRIIFMGRITADLTVKQTSSGKEYLRFSVAVDQPAKDGGHKTD
ncbi:MAG: single-stranded DNA-binding protein, partial [Solobacterium sp.]|nr:single-stranded DNA-binding protein [Solobacterium sp.]